MFELISDPSSYPAALICQLFCIEPSFSSIHKFLARIRLQIVVSNQQSKTRMYLNWTDVEERRQANHIWKSETRHCWQSACPNCCFFNALSILFRCVFLCRSCTLAVLSRAPHKFAEHLIVMSALLSLYKSPTMCYSQQKSLCFWLY